MEDGEVEQKAGGQQRHQTRQEHLKNTQMQGQNSRILIRTVIRKSGAGTGRRRSCREPGVGGNRGELVLVRVTLPCISIVNTSSDGTGVAWLLLELPGVATVGRRRLLLVLLLVTASPSRQGESSSRRV